MRPYKWDGEVIVGGRLPSSGAEYYEVPPDYQVKNYRYAIVNGHTVLVDPATHTIVEVID